MKVAILGYGTIGSGVHEVLMKNAEEVTKKVGENVEVSAVVDLRDLSGTPAENIVTNDFQQVAGDGSISLVVETMGGEHPAYEFVKKCLEAGKHVVTSNKALVAAFGSELMQTAYDNGVNFMFEASVGGGIPILRALTDSLECEKFTKISGILNGTTNYILLQMGENGMSFEDALKKAQELGYAERDPSADIEGWDTCRKIAILASIMTGKAVDYKDIPTEGITKITIDDIETAKQKGGKLKLLGCAEKQDGGVKLSVAPQFVPDDDILSSVNGVYNAVMTESEAAGKMLFFGSGAGKLPTASAVVADIVTALTVPARKPLWK